MTLGDAYGSINSYLEKAGSFQFHLCFNFIIKYRDRIPTLLSFLSHSNLEIQ